MTPICEGHRVTIRLLGRLRDGSGFYDGGSDEPLDFKAGSDQVMLGISRGVLGMSVGERRTIEVAPQLGFGERDESLVIDVPRATLPAHVRVGDRLELALDDGQTAPAWVKELHEECAHLDGNHPLAGETLIFDIEILSVSEQ